MELTEFEQEQIAEQIKQGFTSGRLDNEFGETGTFDCVSWKLKFEQWTED